MKGDFSRVTFRRDKHYVGVELEQGRVIADAAFNEEQAIRQYHEETAKLDIIGASGAPRENAGFSLTSVDDDLRIGSGRYYVDGILAENENTTLRYTNQLGATPIRTQLEESDAELGLAYLEVWHRHITALHDEHIREKALGGPSDSSRIQIWWRVNLLPLASVSLAAIRDELHELLTARAAAEAERTRIRNTNRRAELRDQIEELNGRIQDLLATANIRCDGDFEELGTLQPLGNGRMTAETVAGAAADGPCSLPAEGGFLGLEHQLYRAQIVQGGTRSQARFVYSRENGSVIERITNFSGNEITLQSLGRDLNLGFGDLSRYDFVEIFNDETEALGLPGQLVRVTDVQEDENILELAAAPTISTDLGLNPKVRRWDQRSAQSGADGTMPLNQPNIELDHGIRVNFTSGLYRVGDYWSFPARAAPFSDVEWIPAGEHQPDGVRHHFAPLAFVYRGLADDSLAVLNDCRRIFPPLTAITANDVTFDDSDCNLDAATVQEALTALCHGQSGLCTVTLSPDSDVAAVLGALPSGAHVQICFKIGDYTINQPVLIANLGHVNVTGAGWGTRLRAVGLENALRFDNCASVTVRDLHAETSTAISGDDLGGTLEFRDCSAVTVEHTSLQCGHGTSRRTTCIKVLNTRSRLSSTHGSLRIQHNTLRVGHLQSGMVLVNSVRAQIADNTLMSYAKPSRLGLSTLAAAGDLTYLQPIARTLLTNIVGTTLAGSQPRRTPDDLRLAFTGPRLRVPITDRVGIDLVLPDPVIDIADWQAAITDRNIAINEFQLTTERGVNEFVNAVALNILRNQGNVGRAANNWLTWFERAANDDHAVMGQGIVIGGEVADEVRIVHNTVSTCLQGIHVGLSQRNSSANLQSESTLISQNTVAVSLPTAAGGERHGIFVGNTESCLVEENYLSVERFATTANMDIEAVRLFGLWGERVYVRGNHVHDRRGQAFTIGIRMNPLQGLERRRWLVSDNIATVTVTGQFANLVLVRDNG
ncbi:MAG: DUF6519 domain-containing protein [Caldilineaceae bacterium]